MIPQTELTVQDIRETMQTVSQTHLPLQANGLHRWHGHRYGSGGHAGSQREETATQVAALRAHRHRLAAQDRLSMLSPSLCHQSFLPHLAARGPHRLAPLASSFRPSFPYSDVLSKGSMTPLWLFRCQLYR